MVYKSRDSSIDTCFHPLFSCRTTPLKKKLFLMSWLYWNVPPHHPVSMELGSSKTKHRGKSGSNIEAVWSPHLAGEGGRSEALRGVTTETDTNKKILFLCHIKFRESKVIFATN
jgi:hypothetical protein